MMLVRSSIDAHLSSVPDHGKQEISCVWIPSDQSWQEHLNAATVTEHKHKDDSLSSRNLLSSSQLSTEANMSETSKPNLVYKRRMIQRNTQNSKPTLVYKRKKVQTGFPAQVSTNSCSSSKSNMELGSAPLKHQADDVGECSSSGVVIVEGLRMDILKGTNSCIAFLVEHLVLERFRSNKPIRVEKNVCCLRACKCKVCDRSTTTLKMLICDLCEESFHMSCCNPPVKKVPVGGDWFCHSCSRKKLKKLQETSSGKSPKGYSGPIASMLRDVDPYKSDVRIGKDFQAEIPDWSGPLTDELNDYSEPMEISPLKCASYQDWDSSKLSRLSSIGNWLQCRETVDHVNGTVCGKWRRAPLFEVQTDDWECFSSVLWDPTHADCAVPQELDSDQVLKQLKYIEMLRPRLSAKRWKLGAHKGIDREEHTRDPRNTQNL